MDQIIEQCQQIIAEAEKFLISDAIGLVGVALLIATYAMLQLDKIDPKGFWYSFNNMIVAILVSISLIYTPNIASWVIEVFWFIISVYGIIMYFKRKENLE